MANALPYFNINKELCIDNGGKNHLLIEGDNVDALKAMQYTHKGTVDVIYIDPPYNAGADVNYQDKGWSRTDWIKMLTPSIALGHALLKDSGVIMVSIDDSPLTPYLEILIQNVFGPTNKISTRPWTGKSGGSNGKHLYKEHEFVITYAKSIDDFVSNRQPVDQSEAAEGQEVFVDDSGRRYVVGDDLHGWGGIDKSDATFPLVAPDGTEFYHERTDGTHFDWRVPRTLKSKGMTKEQNMFKLIDDGEVHFYKNQKGKWKASSKKWLNDDMTTLTPSILRQGKASTTMLQNMVGSKAFGYPKPVALLEELVRWAGPKDSVVLDYFAGSGTTGHAVADLNHKDGGSRQFILVTNNENNIFDEATYPRIKAALTGDWANGKGSPREASLTVLNTNTFDIDVDSDHSIMESMSDKFVALAALKEDAYDVEEHTGYFVCRGVVDGLNRTVLVWVDIYDDFGLEDALDSVQPDVAYLACESLSIFGNSLDKFDAQFYPMPVDFAKTVINSSKLIDTITDKFAI
jgi:adenine-specific DNA-methyltransferase